MNKIRRNTGLDVHKDSIFCCVKQGIRPLRDKNPIKSQKKLRRKKINSTFENYVRMELGSAKEQPN